MTSTIIEVSHLTQKYGRHIIFEDFSLNLPEGNIIGLLGPNGAGKTTLMKILTGILRPATGEVKILGASMCHAKSRRHVLAHLSFLPQAFSADPMLTVSQFIEYNLWMRTFPKKETPEAIRAAIDSVGLNEQAHSKLRTLSGGMRQRAGIAAAIAGHPDLIILDEPTAGLDPQQRAQFRQVLATLDTTVLLSTHLVEDIESVATHLVVLAQGRAVHNGSPDVLVRDGDRSVQGLEQQYINLLQG